MSNFVHTRWLALLGSLLMWGSASALETGFLDRRIQVQGTEYRYQVYVPAEYSKAKARVYLTGLSMGGSGAVCLAYQHPERFAALVAICAWVAKPGPEMDSIERQTTDRSLLDATAQRFAKLPVWLFHGDADTAVPVEQSRVLFAALQRVGAAAKYTEIPGGNRNAWDAAYQGEELSAWLFAQRK